MLIGLNGTSQQVTSSGNATDATQPVLISSSSTVSPLSQYLVHPTINEQANVAKKSLPKARLLTSETCLAQPRKKEEDKKKAAEEKERKKREREEESKIANVGRKKKKREERLKTSRRKQMKRLRKLVVLEV